MNAQTEIRPSQEIVQRVDGPLTIERLNEIAKYCEETGEFYSLVQRGKVSKGDVLGRIRDDWYIVIGIDNHSYLAHRLVRFLFDGEWPSGDVDHWDRDTSNNREWNLRHATRGQNLTNAKKPKHNTSGFKGVSWHSRSHRWRAEISVNRERRHLGLFDTAEEAHAAYFAAARELRGDFARSE